MIKTLTLSDGKTALTFKNTLGYKVRYQRAFGVPCDSALMKMAETQDTMVMLQIAYCMLTPTPGIDFETWCDSISPTDSYSIFDAVLELYKDGMPDETQTKKAKN